MEHVITSWRRTVVTRLVERLKSTNSIQTNLTDTDDVMILRSHDFTKTSWLYVKKGYFCQIQVAKDSVPLTYFTLRLTWKTFDNLIIRSGSIGEILLWNVDKGYIHPMWTAETPRYTNTVEVVKLRDYDPHQSTKLQYKNQFPQKCFSRVFKNGSDRCFYIDHLLGSFF